MGFCTRVSKPAVCGAVVALWLLTPQMFLTPALLSCVFPPQGLVNILMERRRAFVSTGAVSPLLHFPRSEGGGNCGVVETHRHIPECFFALIWCVPRTDGVFLLFQADLGQAFSPLFLVAPQQIMPWLHEYHSHCEEILGDIK